MKISRLIVSIVLLLGLSGHAGACIINLGDGAFYYTGLNATRSQNLVNDYLSIAWPALKESITLLGSETRHLPDAELRDDVYKGSFLDNLNKGDLDSIDYEGPGQIRCEDEDTHSAPVPEPATLLLLGSGLIGFVGIGRKIKR